jgi:LysM repeat protein
MTRRQSSAVDKALRMVQKGSTGYAAAKKHGLALSTIYRAAKRAGIAMPKPKQVSRIP